MTVGSTHMAVGSNSHILIKVLYEKNYRIYFMLNSIFFRGKKKEEEPYLLLSKFG